MENWMNWTSFWLIVVLISILVSCVSSSNNDIELTFLTGWWVLSAFALQVVRSNKMEVVEEEDSMGVKDKDNDDKDKDAKDLSAFALQVVRSNKMEVVNGQKSTSGLESCFGKC